MSIFYTLPRIAPLVARHALGYADLVSVELDGLGARLRRRLIAGVVCISAALLTVLSGSGLLVAIAWNTPWRLHALAGLALAFLAIALIAGELARREKRRAGATLARLRAEWDRDRSTLRELLAGRDANGQD